MAKYRVTVSKTADGQSDYMQVMSDDQFSTNIVLVGEIEVSDTRRARKTRGA